VKYDEHKVESAVIRKQADTMLARTSGKSGRYAISGSLLIESAGIVILHGMR
jgi:hypothetical protein